MCLLIFAHRVAPEYPLLVTANRDEYHARPTAASDFWADFPQLLAGRDLLQGGTWMGITHDGRFAAVTNFRDPSRTAAAPRSRGELPLTFLTSSQDPPEFLRDLASRAQDYAGFNLLVGDRDSLWYFSNSDAADPRCLAPGVYGLSNASLDTPWPKVVAGRANLLALLEAGQISHDALASVVADRRLATQDTPLGEGDTQGACASNTMESILTAQFIVTDAYGTRSSTTVWVDERDGVSWREQSFDAQGALREVVQKEFKFAV